jgi:hypothetical protein
MCATTFQKLNELLADERSLRRYSFHFLSPVDYDRLSRCSPHRHDLPIGILISGVSTRPFRREQIGGAENAALHFVPD